MRQAPAQMWALLHGVSHSPVQWKSTTQRNWKSREGKGLIQRQMLRCKWRLKPSPLTPRHTVLFSPGLSIWWEGSTLSVAARIVYPHNWDPWEKKKIKRMLMPLLRFSKQHHSDKLMPSFKKKKKKMSLRLDLRGEDRALNSHWQESSRKVLKTKMCGSSFHMWLSFL